MSINKQQNIIHHNWSERLLESPHDVQGLTVDFKQLKLTALPAQVAELPQLLSLQILNTPADWRVDAELKRLKKLRRLCLTSVAPRLHIPSIFYELPLANLVVRQADSNELTNFSSLTRLETTLEDPENEIRRLSQALPALQDLELWGAHLKKGALPPEIADFQFLERLVLVSLGLQELPEEFSKLSRLKQLVLRGNPMRIFPEVITRLPALEELEFNQRIVDLPAGFANLKELRRADFSGAFNEGTMNAADRHEAPDLKPIPAVLGSLPALEELNLDFCGVSSLEFLRKAPALKALGLKYSGLENCAELGNFTALEALNLECSYKITDLSPLSALKNLQVLNLESLYVKDLSPILEMPALSELNIESCSYIETLAPIYEHPELQTLLADNDILEKWREREKLAGLPTAAQIRESLKKDDFHESRQALENLVLYAEHNSSSKANVLLQVFQVQQNEQDARDDEGLVLLSELDGALRRTGARLSGDLLAGLFGVTYQKYNDGFSATPLILERLLQYKDPDIELLVVQAFQKAVQFYDAGHRSWDGSILDRLIEDFFPRFSAEALSVLLAGCGGDALNSDGGDAMDELFIPALAAHPEPELEQKLLHTFENYFNDSAEYFTPDYWEDLAVRMGANARPEVQKRLNNITAGLALRKEVEADLESDVPERIQGLLARLGKDIPEHVYDGLEYEIESAYRKIKLPFAIGLSYLKFLLSFESENAFAGELLARLALEDLNKLEKELTDAATDREKTAYALEEAIQCSLKNKAARDILLSLRRWANGLVDSNPAENLQNELTRFFRNSLNRQLSGEELEELFDTVSEAPRPIKLELYTGASDLVEQIAGLIKLGAHAAVLRIAHKFSGLELSDSSRENLVMNVIIPVMQQDDQEVLEILLKMLPDEISNNVLAYNLACLYASKGQKAKLLEYAGRAVILGKTAGQFLEDGDFEAFRDDVEFRKVIGGAG